MLKSSRITLDQIVVDLFSLPSFEEYQQALLNEDPELTSYDIIKDLIRF